MTRQNIEDLLTRLDIEPISTNDKGWVLARCPFAEWTHASGEDRNPDFWVKSETGKQSGFHCFSCKQKGPIPSLVKRLERYRNTSYGTLFVEAAIMDTQGGVDSYEVSMEEQIEPEPINMNAYGFQNAWDVPEARHYLIGRGQIGKAIGEETCKILSLKYDPDTKRIVFPVMNDAGSIFGFTGRTILGPEFKVPKVKDYPGLRKERFLLGEQLYKKGRPFWVVEGLFALATMIELGVHHHFNVVALMGSSMSKYQRDIFLYYNEQVFLCLDDDLAGTEGLFGTWSEKLQNFQGNGIIDKLKDHIPVMLPVYPHGITDPDHIKSIDDVLAMSKNVKLF